MREQAFTPEPAPVAGYGGGLVLAFAGAALAWGTAGFTLLALAVLHIALNATWLKFLPLPPLLLVFEINALLAAGLFLACPAGCPGRWQGPILWLVFGSVQALTAAICFAFPAAGVLLADQPASAGYGVFWLPILVLFVAALLPAYKRILLLAGAFLPAALICLALAQLDQALHSPLLDGCLASQFCTDLRSGLDRWLPSYEGTRLAILLGFIGISYGFTIQALADRGPVQGLAGLHFLLIVFLYLVDGPRLYVPVVATAVALLWLIVVAALTWPNLRQDVSARFFLLGAFLYAAGALLSPPDFYRPVNSLAHYTSWTEYPSNLQSLALAASCGAIYGIAARLPGSRGLYSMRLAKAHFWLWALGIPLYNTAMSVSGRVQGMMWRAYDNIGRLNYSFVETVEAMRPYYWLRGVAAVLLAAGCATMAYNVWRTVRPAAK
jgi:cytochrome c oxidase cbb3-type subunit I